MTPMQMLRNNRQAFKKQNEVFFDYAIYHRPQGEQHLNTADFTEIYTAKNFSMGFSFGYYLDTNLVEVCIKPYLNSEEYNRKIKLEFNAFRLALNQIIQISDLTLAPSKLMGLISEHMFSGKVSIVAHNGQIETHIMNYLEQQDIKRNGGLKRQHFINAQKRYTKASLEYDDYIASLPQSTEIEQLQKKLNELFSERNRLIENSEKAKELYQSKKDLRKATKDINNTLSPIKEEVRAFFTKNFPEINKNNDFIIHTDEALIFDEQACQRFLAAAKNDEVERELTQTLFLAICQKHLSLNVLDKNGNAWLVSQSFKNIDNYVPEIIEKIKAMDCDKVFKSIDSVAKLLHYDTRYNHILYGKVYPEVLSLVEPKIIPPSDKDACLINNDFIAFIKTKCEYYLEFPGSDDAKRELSQLLFVDMCMSKKKTLIENGMIIHPNWDEVALYREDIKQALYRTTTEAELIKYMKMVAPYLGLTNEELHECFNTLSIQLGCEESKGINNDIIVLPQTQNNKTNNMLFNEEVCEKLLQKPLGEIGVREFSQAYFLHQYASRYAKELQINEGKTVAWKLDKLDNYIDRIYEKLNGVVTDEQFDKAIGIIIRYFNIDDEEKKEIDRQVTYHVKKSLGLKTPSLFKHLL